VSLPHSPISRATSSPWSRLLRAPAGLPRSAPTFKIQSPESHGRLGDSITFAIHIPLSIDLLLDLRLDKQRFVVSGDIALRATARAAEPLLLIVDVAKPRPSDITVNVSSSPSAARYYASWLALTVRSADSSRSTSPTKSTRLNRKPRKSST